MNRHAAISIAIVAGACSIDEPQLGTTSQNLCAIILCGDNAATAGDGILFDEVDLGGAQNYSKVSLIRAELRGRPVEVHIERDWLSAVDIDDPTITYDHSKLIDLEIEFRYDLSDVESERIDLRVFDVDEHSVHYMSGDRTQIIPAYYLKARRSSRSDEFFEICHDMLLETDPMWTGPGHYALMFRGDRYDPIAKRVLSNDPTTGWSFIACNRSAASKMHMWRHTYAGGVDERGEPTRDMTNDKQRTALLKAITADYCGLGAPQFTETGTPLAFATALEPTALPFPHASINSYEAVWDATGAVCIHKPRLLDRAPDIAATCSIRPCTEGDFLPGWERSYRVITANPTLTPP
jgi:hypothetical protein